MKKILVFFCAIALSAGVASAQSSLSNILSGLSKVTNNETVQSVLGSVLSKVTTVDLTGNWTYQGVSTAVETDNTLTTLAATAYKTKLEKQANNYLKKIGIKEGSAVFTFNSDGTFTLGNGSKTLASGTYTSSDGNVSMKFGKTYNYLTLDGTVTSSTSGCSILFDADKFLSFASTFAKIAGNVSSLGSTVSSLVDQVTGLKLGFNLSKTA